MKNKATISFEVFPPKNKEGDISSIYRTIDELAKLNPDFISVTYGAGGSTKGKTVEIASKIKNDYHIESVAHLTCISSTKEEVLAMCQQLKDNNIENDVVDSSIKHCTWIKHGSQYGITNKTSISIKKNLNFIMQKI